MSSIPLPALDIKAPPQQDLLQKYSQLAALRNAQQEQQQREQEAPLRIQALNQQVQAGGLQLEQEQQTQKDQMAFRDAMKDPSLQGKTIGDIADTLAQKGQISQAAWTTAKKADIDHRTALAGLDEKTLVNQKAGHAATQELYNNVMNLPDDQLAANWPQIAQQYDAIPGNQKQPLNPNQPLTKEQLSHFGPMISMSDAYFDQELSRREKIAQTNKEKADAEKAALENDAAKQIGGLPGAPPSTNATRIYAIPEAQRTPAQNLFIKGYEKNNDVTKVLPAQVRVQAILQQPQAVVDPNDPSKTTYVSKKDAVGMEAPSSGEAAGARAVVKSAIGGKLGDTLNSFNTATAHLDQLDKAADALKNGDVQAINKIGNEFAKQTGNPAPTNFQAVKSAVAGEVSKTFKGGQATDAEIKEFESAISSANSPAQLKGVIQTYKGLMASKRDAIKQQIEKGKQGQVNTDPTDSGAAHPFFSQFGGTTK